MAIHDDSESTHEIFPGSIGIICVKYGFLIIDLDIVQECIDFKIYI